jgi:hypothetical protein
MTVDFARPVRIGVQISPRHAERTAIRAESAASVTQTTATIACGRSQQAYRLPRGRLP